jgi:hypothetical protein
MTSNPTPKKRKLRKSEIPFSFLPIGNPPAVGAYLCFLFGLIPGLGIILGPIAALLGLFGFLKARKLDPPIGLGHGFVCMVFGPFQFVCHAVGLYLLFGR